MMTHTNIHVYTHSLYWLCPLKTVRKDEEKTLKRHHC